MKNQKHKWTIEEEEALLTIFQEEKTIAKENPRAGPKVWLPKPVLILVVYLLLNIKKIT